MSEIAQRRTRACRRGPQRPRELLGRFRRMLPLVLLASFLASGCGSDDNGDLRTLLALLVARQLGLQAIPAGSNCPTGDPSCPSATEGDLTVFPGSVTPGQATFEVTPSCGHCAVEVWGPSPNSAPVLLLSAFVDEVGQPLVVSGSTPATTAAEIQVRVLTPGSGWVADAAATVRPVER